MGAPRKNPPKDAVESIERLAAQGHSIIGIAKQLGVSRETFKRWCKKTKRFKKHSRWVGKYNGKH
jgi:DNA invertase Pin-like site-specific DNA recombinase